MQDENLSDQIDAACPLESRAWPITEFSGFSPVLQRKSLVSRIPQTRNATGWNSEPRISLGIFHFLNDERLHTNEASPARDAPPFLPTVRESRTDRARDVRALGMPARARARVIDVTKSSGVHATHPGFLSGTEKSFLDPRDSEKFTRVLAIIIVVSPSLVGNDVLALSIKSIPNTVTTRRLSVG